MKIFSSIVNFFTKPVADIVGGWQGRKNVAAETASTLAKLDGKLKAAKVQAKIDRVTNQDSADSDYDGQVLKNRALSVMDEVLIVFWLVIFVMHFIPDYAPKMAAGWTAIGQAPWWFQFGMLGILVSTLGLMRLFRMYTENKFSFKKDK
jgi:hypothetical protein